MIKRKFKVGDVVNAVNCETMSHAGHWQGVTIIRVEDHKWPYTVIGSKRYPDEEGAFAEHELVLAE